MYPILGVYISDFDSLNMNEILKRNAVDTFSNVCIYNCGKGKELSVLFRPHFFNLFSARFCLFFPKSFSVAVRSSGLNGVNHGY